MWGWWRRAQRGLPLTGAPALRRQKSYSGRSGYVYQYFYEGQRPAERGREQGREYVFSVSADRKNWVPVSVFVGQQAVGSWEQSHGRALTATEWYAAAKMSLFQAFDERPGPEALSEEIRVRPADLEAILERLGLD